jgi:uncharacterized membrane protein YjjP (DUF1212 family)
VNTQLAVISGEALVDTIIQVVVGGLIFALLYWLIDITKIPEPFNKVARVVLAIVGVLFLISVLLALTGHPLIKW